MIEAFVRLLRPVIMPVLRLKLDPPHLPEGTALVRHLKPSESWLTYQYLMVMLGLLGQLIGVGVGIVLLVARLGGVGVAVGALLGVAELLVLGVAFVTTRVDFELRHYLVGDRSLRASMGAFTRREVTLSYANVQNLEVNQGPLERVFGFKSLTVTTAGGDSSPTTRGRHDNLHVVTLVGLENADELRELVLGMLKQHKDAGLGEPVKPDAGLNLALLAEVRDAAVGLRGAASTAPH